MKLSNLAAAIVLGSLAFSAITAPTARAQGTLKNSTVKVDLRPKWKAGQETRLKLDMDSSGKQNTPAAGESPVMQMTMNAVLRFKCKDANPETGSTLEAGFESVKMSVKSPLGNMDFDSTANDPDNPLKSMFDSPMTVKMDAAGNISSVDGDASGMALMGGGDAMKQMFQKMLGPVTSNKKDSGQHAIGESWTDDSVVGGLGGAGIHMTMTNTLKSLMGQMATIDVKGAVTMDASAADQGISIKDSSIAGEYKVNTEDGQIESGQMRTHLAIEQKQDKAAPTRTSQDMTMKITRVRGGAPDPKGDPKPGATPPGNDPKTVSPKDWGQPKNR